MRPWKLAGESMAPWGRLGAGVSRATAVLCAVWVGAAAATAAAARLPRTWSSSEPFKRAPARPSVSIWSSRRRRTACAHRGRERGRVCVWVQRKGSGGACGVGR